MAKSQSFFLSKSGKTWLNYAYSFGAAIVIAGALFKLMHWPFASLMLIVGMSTEVLIFIISAFEPQFEHHEEYQWERVYPELANDELSSSGKSSKSLTKSLDDMLAQANVEQDMISRLGSNLGKLSENVSKMGDMSDAMAATSDYSTNARAAANALGQVKDAYAAALSSADGLAATLDSMKAISQSTASVQTQMNDLSGNLSSLNKVYGNMLSAMKA
ncbi:MAG: gliding motility protein GldL [Chitinophagales bacterium]|nr:gliding motility protein GldL [Bacteroidota bacterium]MCB9255985.1 gliding motility protein GldL [Chitinophagales bacterium]